MAEIDVTRIAGNIGAMNALNSLQNINKQLSVHQTRLATGKRINSAADDPAGLTIATKMNSQSEGLKVALSNIGDAKNLLAVAESGLGRINDIMVQMRNKAEAGASDTMGADERAAIATQLKAYAAQIDDIAKQTKWNGNSLINGAYSSASLTFQTGPGTGDTTTLTGLTDVSATSTTGSLSLGSVDASGAYTILASGTSGTDLSSAGAKASDFSAYMGVLDGAMKTVSTQLSLVGATTGRLSFKEDQVSAMQVNVEAAYNRIMNANMAEEQVNASKYQILQQTATAMLAQANAAPQFLLSLFR